MAAGEDQIAAIGVRVPYHACGISTKFIHRWIALEKLYGKSAKHFLRKNLVKKLQPVKVVKSTGGTKAIFRKNLLLYSFFISSARSCCHICRGSQRVSSITVFSNFFTVKMWNRYRLAHHAGTRENLSLCSTNLSLADYKKETKPKPG